MFIECLAILAVIAIVIVMTVRSGRRTYALTFLPLLIVPAAYLLSAPISSLLEAILPIARVPLTILVTVIGLVVACVLFGMLCGNFETRRARRGYLWMCGGFSTILTVVLIVNLIRVML